jgi:hypothetical protein
MADTDYYLQRAKHEAILAIQADHPATAASHQGLSVRYSARAVLEIVDEQDTPKERVRHRSLVATLEQV